MYKIYTMYIIYIVHTPHTNAHIYIYNTLVGGFNPSEKKKNISQLRLLFPIYGKIKMWQTTN